MQVPLERSPRLGLSISSVHPAFLVEPVTLVVARPVLGPRPHAHPTKLPLALLACHVTAVSLWKSTGNQYSSLAAAVLLDS